MSENIKDIYPLSPMQQGMLFHSLYAPETEAYSEQLSCKLIGKLDMAAFKRAWQAVVDRHDTLKTAFVWEDLDEPLQVVYKDVQLPFEILDWRDLPQQQREKDFLDLLETERRRGLELTEAPLMRIVLIQADDAVFHLIWNHHHLLMDGWGLPIILREVMIFYEAFSNGRSLSLPQTRPYRDYIAWLQQQDMKQAEQFWKKRLEGFVAPTPLVIEQQTDASPADYNKIRFIFSQEDSDLLNRFSKENQITLNTLLQAAWAFLLHRYSGEDDVVFGATVSGRPPELPGVEEILGLFINTLPVRATFNDQKIIREWLQDFQMAQAETRQYEYSPLVEIHKWSDVPNSQPLFKSLLVFENYPAGEQLEQKESALQLTDVRSFERTNYPLTVVGSPGKQLAIDIAYETDKFDEPDIRRMQQHIHNILMQFARQSEQKLSAISLITEKEQQKVIIEWNQSELDYPREATIHGIFAAQVKEHPDAVAVSFEDQSLTYRELDEKANRLANVLRAKGVDADVLAGISLERSIETVIAALAVLKAGGAYLPIDPEYPEDRIRYMIEDSEIQLLISQQSLADLFKNVKPEFIALETIAAELKQQAPTAPENHSGPDNLAYVIYTSGSTGRPKGVLLPHRGAANLFANMKKDFLLEEGKSLLQLASFSFDAATGEIFAALLNGSAVQMIPKDTLLSTDKFVDFLKKHPVTTATIPPSLLALLPENKIDNFETIISIGDACTIDLARRWHKKCRFFNGYGPTEGTIGAIWGQVASDEAFRHSSVPIGKPLANVKIYILDPYLHPAPVGVPGEIHIGGPGVARGYLNRPELTAEKFIADPFTGVKGARLYKTGDLARWLPDGRIEFIGRVDFQVKIRGFRIELGEIEAEISKQENIKDVIVAVHGDKAGDKKVVAYLIAQNDKAIDLNQLRSALKENLPDYMIPAAFVVMETFPLTPNGKVNRKALPAPEQADFAADDYVAPRTPEEELLASIWADILKLDKVGVKSNFFDLGGHSLLATQVISRIRDAFDVDIELKDLFETPTIATIAETIEQLKKDESGISLPPIEKVDHNQELPLSFAQQRLWFLSQLEPESPAYNIPSAFILEGNLDTLALEKSIMEVVKRHESLRTTFTDRGGKPVQIISAESNFKITHKDLSDLPQKESEQKLKSLAKEDALKPFDLAVGPLFRVALIKLPSEKYAILFNMHHIISDGWSVSVLISEIVQLYAAFSHGQPSPLAELEIQYADFAHWQQNWLQGETLEKQIRYWKEKLSDAPPLLELPADHPRPAVQTVNGAKEAFELDAELSSAIKDLTKQEGATLFMVLLAAFQTLLHRYSGQEQILVGSPIANRTNSKIEKLIGFFVNTLIMKADFAGNPEFTELLRQVRDNALEAYAHQDLPFEKLVEELQPQRDPSHAPIFQVAFVLQNTPTDTAIQLPGLTLKPVQSDSATAKYDLTLTMVEAGDHLLGSLEYNTDLFERSTIQRMLNHLRIVLQAISEEPEIEVDTIPLLTEEERQLILYERNQTESSFPADKSVHQVFEELSKTQPEAPALIFAPTADATPEQLTYAELNARANQLARYLQNLDVQNENIVGICMDRSPEMIVSMLAILKAGAAYVPIDPNYPAERIQYMAQDSALRVLLTQKHLQQQLAGLNVPLIAVDSAWPEIAKESQENLGASVNPQNLAYLIYTSGSTGKPKGAMLHHRGAVNLATLQQKAFKVGTGSRILQFASLSFDAATWEFLMALLSGSALVVTSAQTITDGQALARLLEAQQVTTITLPPSVLAVLPKSELPHLKMIITAGEAVSPELVQTWGKERIFFNAYGPTETTVCASMHQCSGTYETSPPIGKANPNFKLYILDEYMQPVPVGVPGELCVAGVGLARGYLNRPELTAEKFVANPFAAQPGERIYRTGDLARWLPDGNVEFMGRIDYQVKVRGFRIELGEIEAALSRHEKIKDQIVLARPDKSGDKRLVAYMVTEEDRQLTPEDVRNYLSSQLPDYMVPAVYVFLDAMPLTPNGKVDRRALPKPDLEGAVIRREYVAPRNDTEEKLIAMVTELLHLEKVGVLDNFFELGGHSLLATQFMSRIKETFQVELPLMTLFEKPTIEQLAVAVIDARAKGVAPTKPQIKRVDRGSRRVKRSDLQNRSNTKPGNNNPS